MADKEYAFANIGDGIQLVAAAGTAEALSATSVACRLVVVQARPENTNDVVVGASTVVAASGTRRGITLSPGQSAEFHVKDVSSLYVDAETNGEGVSYVYFW